MRGASTVLGEVCANLSQKCDKAALSYSTISATEKWSVLVTPSNMLTFTRPTGSSISLDLDGFQNEMEGFTMSEKLDKLRASLEKEQERRIKINNRIESLERRIQEAEAAKVNEMVRTAKVTPEQLAALLRQSANTTPNPAALAAVGATFDKEDDSDEV